jgi:hypothetical protein
VRGADYAPALQTAMRAARALRVLDLDLDAAVVDLDLGPVLHILRRLSAGEPAGNALVRRINEQPHHDTSL